MKGKKLTAEEIAKCEKLIAKGFKDVEIEEMLDIGRSSARRIRNKEQVLQRPIAEPQIVEPETDIDSVEPETQQAEITLADIVANQREIITLLRQYLAEWRVG
jgi:hypothetical protein